jgi:hypothetical protein
MLKDSRTILQSLECAQGIIVLYLKIEGNKIIVHRIQHRKEVYR